MNQKNKGYNLIDENWIPVTGLKGEHRHIGLKELFVNGNRYSDLAVRPHERAALMRLLLCIAHAALDGPGNAEEWKRVPELLPGKAKVYLEKWREAFDLFHPGQPFLQMKKIKSAAKDAESNEGTSIAKLDFALASGNNPTLFDHEANASGQRGMNESQMILALLAFQNFSPGGTIGKVYWNTIGTKGTSLDAPCARDSMYHAFIRAEHILNTLHMNLITKNDLALHYRATGDDWWGQPVWELGQFRAVDKAKIKIATGTFLGRLVPLKRLILFNPDKQTMLLGDGLVYPAFTDPKNPFPAEPTATVIIKKQNKKEEYALLGCKANKAPWRELAAMLVKRASKKNGGTLSLSNLDTHQSFDLHILGVAKHQASILDMVESVYHLPGQMLTMDGLAAYEKDVEFTETISWKLGKAIEQYRKTFDGGWEGRIRSAGANKSTLLGQLHSRATIHYWTVVEKTLNLMWEHVEALDTTGERVTAAKLEWQKAVYAAAREAYELVCGRETPRQLRAFALGWEVLNRRQEKEQGKEHTNNEEVDA